MGELERGDVEVVGGELDELSAVALADADKTRRRNVEILQRLRGAAEDRASRSPSASASSPLRSSCSATSTATCAP